MTKTFLCQDCPDGPCDIKTKNDGAEPPDQCPWDGKDCQWIEPKICTNCEHYEPINSYHGRCMVPIPPMIPSKTRIIKDKEVAKDCELFSP